MIEEEEPVAAEKILDVVLGRDDERVDPRFLQERVQPAGVERNWPRGGRRARCVT